MIRVVVCGPHTVLRSTLCAGCLQGSRGCCFSPPEYDWSDIGRVVALGGCDFLLKAIEAGRVTATARGLALRRVRRRYNATERRQPACVYHGASGCTVDESLRPATCNYYLCEDAFRVAAESQSEAAVADARRRYLELRETYSTWDETLGRELAAAAPEGIHVNADLLRQLGEAFRSRFPIVPT